MKRYKILCTGNPEHFTVARAVKQIFPNADFASRASGYDLRMWDIESLDFFKKQIVNYDVLINSSFISNGAQQKILETTKDCWTNGHVFNIGSTAEYLGRDSFLPHYSIQKRALRELSLSLNSKDFKTTHIIPSGLNDGKLENKDFLDPIYIAKVIKFVLEFEMDVPIIGIEKI